MTQPNNNVHIGGRYKIGEVISGQGPNDKCPPTPRRPNVGTNAGTNTRPIRGSGPPPVL